MPLTATTDSADQTSAAPHADAANADAAAAAADGGHPDAGREHGDSALDD